MAERRQPYRAGGHYDWAADDLRALRRHLRLTQRGLADELGVRQQTVSEWETGMYRPRGAARRLLGIVAERAGFAYVAASEPAGEEEADAARAQPGEEPP
ncbi:MAG TPA: helix-turn-helix domain-containing protein [Dehalococcoidia bacterium]|nr:helix-turn-helix domain-containing protein [Dehalococcoidia bacterium]